VTARPRFVSIVLPCRNEEPYIGACLDSILAGDYPRDRLEVLVLDGRSDDRTREIVAQRAGRAPAIRLLDNPQRVTPAALNLGIRAARGEVILRMDAHVEYPPHYVTRLVAALEATGADNVGCLLATVPADSSPVARAIAVATAHRFGVGNSYFRIGTTVPRWVDTVAFGCWRREVFERIGLFDEDLVRNQDDEFNFRLVARGGRILLLPDVVARYYARRTLGQLARMFYQYGYYKPLVARKVGRVMTVRQLVPALFLLTLTGAAALGAWVPLAAWAGAAAGAAYAAVDLGCAAAAAPRHGPRAALALAAAFPIIHFSYGLGFLAGLVGHRSRSAAPSAVPLSR